MPAPLGGRGPCSKCGKWFDNVAFHEARCGEAVEPPEGWNRGSPADRFNHLIEALSALFDDSANAFMSDPPEDRYIKKVEEMIDTLDLMRDEFQRISVSPGSTTEIQALCSRAVQKIEQRVSVIYQRDRLETKLGVANLEIDNLRHQVSGLQRQISGKNEALRTVPLLGDIIRWRSTGTDKEREHARGQADTIFKLCAAALNSSHTATGILRTEQERYQMRLRWSYNQAMKNLVKPIMTFEEWIRAVDNSIEAEQLAADSKAQHEEDARAHETERMIGVNARPIYPDNT